MNKKLLNFTIFIALLLVPIHYEGFADALEDLKVNQGLLDLTETFNNKEIITLEGNWEFYWNKLLTAEDFTSPRQKTYIEAPAVWKNANYSGTETLSNEGYGTYRLIIKINEEYESKALSLYIPPVASAFQLFVDGELLAQNGIVGTDRKSMKPKSYSQVATFLPKSNDIEIIMQVSNFSQRKGGMWSPLKFGLDSEISKQRELNIIREVVTAASLFALGFYHISLYLFRATTLLPMFLGIFCLVVSLRTLLVGEILLMYLFPHFSWEWSVKVEYLTFYVGLMVVFIFLAYLFPKEMNKKVVVIFSIVSVLFTLSTLFPAFVYTHLMQPYQVIIAFVFIYCLYAVVLATIRKREGSLINLLSISFLVLSVFNDFFYYNHWTNSIDFTPIAAYVFLFLQTLIVAKKSSNAFKRVELLSHELHEVNSSLEQIVAERTQDLQSKNTKLNNIEKTRKSYFSAVAHEIGTPMQSIQGYIQLLQAKVQSKEQQDYLNIIFEKTKMLNHLSKDLLDLARMDEGQFEFIPEETDAIYLFEYLYDRFKFDITSAGLNCKYTPANSPNGYTILINTDIFRMEQVFSNLINNAIKFTPQDGLVHIKLEFTTDKPLSNEDHIDGFLRIEVIDTGAGIDEDLLPYIFDRFVKSSKSLTSRKGTGLGLAICKEIIKKHEGKITVESKVGTGSRFIIELPALLVKEEHIE